MNMGASAVATEQRSRDPERTRARLIECAFREIRERGFEGASLDRILADTGVTKGALYHHFGSKAELLHAVIDEAIAGMIEERWLAALARSEDPISELRAGIVGTAGSLTDEDIAWGCPLNNITQEMAATDDELRAHVERLYSGWRDSIAAALERGQKAGNVRGDVDPAGAAAFIVAGIEGLAGTTKSHRSRAIAGATLQEFVRYLEGMRPLETG